MFTREDFEEPYEIDELFEAFDLCPWNPPSLHEVELLIDLADSMLLEEKMMPDTTKFYKTKKFLPITLFPLQPLKSSFRKLSHTKPRTRFALPRYAFRY